MILARRSATADAPSRHRRLFHRAVRQSPAPLTPAGLGRREMITMVTVVLIGLIALVAVVAAISYSHMYDWAKLNKEPEWRARLSPISADGAILVASVVMYVDARLRHRKDPLAYALLTFGIAWSVFANVMHDWQNVVAAKLIAGWPPIAMAAAVELLLRFARRLRERSDEIARRAEKAQAKPERVDKVPAPRVEPAPPAEPTFTPEIDLLTKEMLDAGWAPSDYQNMGDAMLGYLHKVDPDVGGADLHRLVGVRFFGADPDNDTGMGRRAVRKFKATQAADATRKE